VTSPGRKVSAVYIEVLDDSGEYQPQVSSIGWIATIHESSETPVMSAGFTLLGGQVNAIAIKQTLTQALPPPYGNCWCTYADTDYCEASRIGGYTITYVDNSYSPGLCFDECLAQAINDTCGCVYYFATQNSSAWNALPNCASTANMTTCADNTTIHANCSFCQSKCVSTDFQPEISQSQLAKESKIFDFVANAYCINELCIVGGGSYSDAEASLGTPNSTVQIGPSIPHDQSQIDACTLACQTCDQCTDDTSFASCLAGTTANDGIINQQCGFYDAAKGVWTPKPNGNYTNAAFSDDNIKDIISASFFFDELNLELIVESPAYDLGQFFGEFGGYLGLFLGMSVLSIAELVTFYGFVLPFSFCGGGQKSNDIEMK